MRFQKALELSGLGAEHLRKSSHHVIERKKKSARKALMLAEILSVCPVSKIMECQEDEEFKANWFLEEGNLSGRRRASAT